MTTALRTILALGSGLGLLSALGCQQQQQQDIPNRVLDRPTDVALVCTDLVCETEDDVEICTTQPQPLEVCKTESGSCSSDNPHLVGFVANSERNEIAMFTKCSNRLVDMDVSSPGYDFIPAGLLPTELDASADGCRVVSANVGSCDFTVLDAPGLARYGLGSAADLGRTDQVDEPSSLVSTLTPQTYDGDTNSYRPLGARPGQIALVPSTLTQAPGLDPTQTLEGVCDPLVRRSVYATFPTCNLVAEIDLRTGYVLQSRQFQTDADGAITVVDQGVSPSCPVECPVQFDGELPAPQEIDADGPFIQALALSLESPPPPEGTDDADPDIQADLEIEGQRLFLGGFGSNHVFELPILDSGVWGPSTQSLELRNAGGIKNIDVSPAVNAPVATASFAQFLYVIAGDGSTRVVGRALPADADSVGVECETQSDPIVLTQGATVSACVPVSQSPNEDQPPERRGFSRGPGIRPGRGEEVTDWLFRKSYESNSNTGETSSGPFREPSTAAIGVTTGGFAVYAMLDQARASGETTVADVVDDGIADPDPARIMDVRLFAHSIWPAPIEEGAGIGQLPLVSDAAPSRSMSSSATDPIRFLGPSLRRIDDAYVSEARAFEQLNVVADYDGLGGGYFYEEPAVRAVVHDYRAWGDSGGPNWTLEWEGTIPNTQSSTGRIECDIPGWPSPDSLGGTDLGWKGGTCLVGATLIDDGANFCDDGVLAGDKLVIIGCNDDSNCGDGRRCLRQSVAGGESSGICISAQTYEQHAADLREICGPFISDPCGEAFREFEIIKATPNTLELAAIQQPLLSHLADTPCEDVENAVLVGDECRCLPGFGPAACDAGQQGCCLDPAVAVSGQAPVLEVIDQYVCTNWQPDSGCETDADCKCDPESEADMENGCDEASASGICVESRCRRPCDPETGDCIFRRLPGPDCFGEFVRYQVALRNAFRVSGPGIEFISDRVEAVDINGEMVCRETVNAELSQLLTSRLPLPSSDDPDDPEWLAIPACGEDLVFPGDPNPCRIVNARAEENTFHVFEYEGQATVSALRFSNPVFSIILDLTSLEALTSDVEGYDNSAWPIDFARFHRSRMPRSYRLAFGLQSGYEAFADRLTLEGRPVTYPIRIVAGPQSDVAYIVDGSGPGSSSSIRGQVVRVTLGDFISADEAFIGVR